MKVGVFLTVVVGLGFVLGSCSDQSTTAQRVTSRVGSSGLDADIAQIRTDASNVARIEKVGKSRRNPYQLRGSRPGHRERQPEPAFPGPAVDDRPQ